MTSFGKVGPAAENYLQSLAIIACSTGVVDRGMWLRIARQYLSCASVRCRGVVFCQCYRSVAKSVGKDFRDVTIVHLNEMQWNSLYSCCLLGFVPSFYCLFLYK
jgi:hypothetical protein